MYISFITVNHRNSITVGDFTFRLDLSQVGLTQVKK